MVEDRIVAWDKSDRKNLIPTCFLWALPELNSEISNREELFSICKFIAGNSLLVTSKVEAWTRDRLQELKSVTPEEFEVVAKLNPRWIPSEWYTNYDYVKACVKEENIPALFRIRSQDHSALIVNRDRLIAEKVFISLEAWEAIKD